MTARRHAAAAPASGQRRQRGRFRRFLTERFDDILLQGVLGAMIAGAGTVLVMDYLDLEARIADSAIAAPAPQTSANPLPSVRPSQDGAPPRRLAEAMRAPMRFELAPGGRLLATGTIEPGTAAAFAEEIEQRGGYVTTVVLRSPGGSVSDALEMGRLVRSRGYMTEIEPGAYCASSCPLVFAGGFVRQAGEKAAIGVHQIFAATTDGLTVAGSMDSAQRISASCQKYLAEMGVDLRVWVHAMETPKERLYYFTPAELIELRLATRVGAPEAEPEPPSLPAAEPTPSEPPTSTSSAARIVR